MRRSASRHPMAHRVTRLALLTWCVATPRMVSGQTLDNGLIGTVTYRWTTPTGTLEVLYELRPGWRFVGKTVRVAPLASSYHVDSITVMRTRLPARMAPEWTPNGQAGPEPGLDEAEVAAFTAMVRAAMVYQPTTLLHVFVGWTANDYQIDVPRPEGRAEHLRVFDQGAAVGARHVLYGPSSSALSRREDCVDDWSWEHVLWLGLGQQIRRGTWNPHPTFHDEQPQSFTPYPDLHFDRVSANRERYPPAP